MKTDESENSINSIEDDNSALPSPIEKTETSKPAVLESDTAIQSKTSEVFQSETTALKPEQQSVSNDAYESVVLKQTEQKKGVAQSNGYQKRSPYIASKTALATVEQKSLEKKHKSANFSSFLTQKALLIIARIKRLLNSLKSVSKLKINKSKGMQDLFWSIGLFILGILTVIILGKL